VVVGTVLGLVVVCLAALLVARASRYRRLLADAHFLEVGRGLARIKAAALAKIVHAHGDEPQSADDARILTTTAGLAVVYTVSQELTGHLHHCSVSVIGGPTPHAVGATFILFVAQLLGLPIARLRLEIGASTVHHAEVRLDQAEHQRLAAASVPELDASAMVELRRDAFESRTRLLWQSPPTPPG